MSDDGEQEALRCAQEDVSNMNNNMLGKLRAMNQRSAHLNETGMPNQPYMSPQQPDKKDTIMTQNTDLARFVQQESKLRNAQYLEMMKEFKTVCKMLEIIARRNGVELSNSKNHIRTPHFGPNPQYHEPQFWTGTPYREPQMTPACGFAGPRLQTPSPYHGTPIDPARHSAGSPFQIPGLNRSTPIGPGFASPHTPVTPHSQMEHHRWNVQQGPDHHSVDAQFQTNSPLHGTQTGSATRFAGTPYIESPQRSVQMGLSHAPRLSGPQSQMENPFYSRRDVRMLAAPGPADPQINPEHAHQDVWTGVAPNSVGLDSHVESERPGHNSRMQTAPHTTDHPLELEKRSQDTEMI